MPVEQIIKSLAGPPILRFHPTLAVRIGVNQAIVLTWVSELAKRSPTGWVQISDGDLETQFPFWRPDSCRRMLRNCAMLGVLKCVVLLEGSGEYTVNWDALDGLARTKKHDAASDAALNPSDPETE